jgi:hypothetical protein
VLCGTFIIPGDVGAFADIRQSARDADASRMIRGMLIGLHDVLQLGSRNRAIIQRGWRMRTG